MYSTTPCAELSAASATSAFQKLPLKLKSTGVSMVMASTAPNPRSWSSDEALPRPPRLAPCDCLTSDGYKGNSSGAKRDTSSWLIDPTISSVSSGITHLFSAVLKGRARPAQKDIPEEPQIASPHCLVPSSAHSHMNTRCGTPLSLFILILGTGPHR